MYKSYNSPNRDYLTEWLEAERQLAIAGYCSPAKKNIDDFPSINDEPSHPIPDKTRKIVEPSR